MADSSPTPFQITPIDLALAPARLAQQINPWFANAHDDQFGLITINLGQAGDPETERKLLAEVGSYGRQIGHIGEALEVLIDLVQSLDPEAVARLSQKQKDALAILKGDVAKARSHKA